jgi:hypothetical protein
MVIKKTKNSKHLIGQKDGRDNGWFLFAGIALLLSMFDHLFNQCVMKRNKHTQAPSR